MWTFEKQEQKCSLYDSAEMKVKTIHELGYSFSFKEAVCLISFQARARNFGPKKRHPLFNSNHVLATTGKNCSKKKSAFAQIIKGGNVILGDFLG